MIQLVLCRLLTCLLRNPCQQHHESDLNLTHRGQFPILPPLKVTYISYSDRKEEEGSRFKQKFETSKQHGAAKRVAHA